MSNKILFIVFLLVPTLMMAQDKAAKESAPAQHEFVGVKTCGMCHKSAKQGKQLSIWENSKHAQAYKTLETAEADKIAKEKGFDTPAVKTEACLKCHAIGYNVDKKLLGKHFKVEQGVQCETCHGAGGDYKNMKVMKNKKLAMENGLQIHENLKEFCTTCHNPESPGYKKDQNIDKMWEQIKHDIPQGK